MAIIVPSVCFPRIPSDTTADEITLMFEDVERVDMVLMEDEKGEFQMAFVHFCEPEKMRGFVEHIASHAFYMNGWLVRPNYKPVKPSKRVWTEEEKKEIEIFFKRNQGSS